MFRRWHHACSVNRVAFDPAGSSARRMVPPGRNANPSAWSARARILVLAATGLAIATYLTTYQLGMIATVWDPIFGAGSVRVLHSSLSRALPVPDASLGAVGYLFDLVLTGIGGEDRWRSRPVVVVGLGVVATGMALASIGLIIFQALVVRAFCTLCLGSAGLSVVIWPLAWEEVAAALAIA